MYNIIRFVESAVSACGYSIDQNSALGIMSVRVTNESVNIRNIEFERGSSSDERYVTMTSMTCQNILNREFPLNCVINSNKSMIHFTDTVVVRIT